MASRFRLSVTPQDPHGTLEIRGISRGGVAERRHPYSGIPSLYPSGHNISPDYASDDDDESTIKDGSSDHYSPRAPLGEDDLSNSDSSHYWYGANSSTTGNTTERSSIYSWGDDVLDHKTSRDVQEMFQAIERMLFESVLSGSSLLQKECREWMDVFPHLRVKGKQALHTKDEGYQCFPSTKDPAQISSPMTSYTTNEFDTAISLTGSSINPIAPPTETSDEQSLSLSHLHEEIFEIDGEIEEYLAFDFREIEEEDSVKRYHVPRRRRLGYPPITPNACVRDAVINQLFDNAWVKLISCLKKVKVRNETPKTISKSFWKVLFDSYGSISGKIDRLRNFDDEPFYVDEQMGSQLNFMDDPLVDPFPPSRELGDQSIRHSRLSGRNNSQKNDFTSLTGLMMIKRKELLARTDRPNGAMPIEQHIDISTPLERSVALPRGSSSRLHLPGTASPQMYNQFIPLTMTRQTSAKHRGRGKQFHPSKLHPLIDRVKTPSSLHKDWTIKGRNMPLSSLGLSHLDDHSEVVGIHVTSPTSPPPTAPAIPGGSLYHPKTLPPLHLQSLNENSSLEFGKISRRANRVSSAAPVDSKLNARGFDGSLRPNTTHAFRNDNFSKLRALSTTPSNVMSRPFGGRGLQPVKSTSPTGFSPGTAGNFLYSHSPDNHQHGLAGIHGIGMMGHSNSPHEQDDDGRQGLGWGSALRRRQVMGS